jgi:hypothetical protein
LKRVRRFAKRGSGSSGLEFRRPAADAKRREGDHNVRRLHNDDDATFGLDTKIIDGFIGDGRCDDLAIAAIDSPVVTRGHSIVSQL